MNTIIEFDHKGDPYYANTDNPHYPTGYLSCPCFDPNECICSELAEDFDDLARNRRVYLHHYDLEDHAAEIFLQAHPEFRQDFKPYYFQNSYPEEMDWISVYAEQYETDTGFPLRQESGPDPHATVVRNDEWDGIYSNRDLYQNNSFLNATYRDTEPTRCTNASAWFIDKSGPRNVTWGCYNDLGYNPRLGYNTPHYPVVKFKDGSTVQMSATPTHISRRDILNFSEAPVSSQFGFEEIQGFTTELLINMGITKKYHYTVFNIYEGNDTFLHIGRCTLSTSVDGLPQATCKQCNRTHVFSGSLDNRNDQEAFVVSLIRHGNNHGPTWLTSRSDFTFIHATNCDTRHPKSTHCNANDPRLLRADLLGSLDNLQDFLVVHRRYCPQSTCRCTHYYHLISELVRNDSHELQAA